MSEPPPYLTSSASLPGPDLRRSDQRTGTIGLVALILGILETIYAGSQLVGVLFGNLFVRWQRTFFKGLPGSSAAMPDEMFDAMDRMMKRSALGQSVRMVAFLAVTAWLIVLAVQLRRGRVEALQTAKSWMWLALGAIGLSSLVQAFVLVPAQIAYQREVMEAMTKVPGRPLPPGLIEDMNTMTTVMMALTAFGGAVLLAIWPIAFRVWAGKIQKQVEVG